MKASTRITEWEAEDGTKFDNRLDCEVYEKGLDLLSAFKLDGEPESDAERVIREDILANAEAAMPALRKYVAALKRQSDRDGDPEVESTDDGLDDYDETSLGEDTVGGARADAHMD